MLPTATFALGGATVIVSNTAELTLMVVVVLMPLKVAVMTEGPVAIAVTKPLLAATVETVALAGVAELKLVVAVTFTLLPSEYLAVEVSCCVVPICMTGLAGVNAMESKLAGVTVSKVVADRAPETAVMTDEPIATPVANPVLLIVADAGVADVKLEIAVMSLVVPSE
ncbi:hypothetical protein UNDKW_1581 [Undibacterium sp. KW1]|nr:hypothetical protein UNDKW_1581 [Undibacterium sp. KW1]